MHAVLRDLFCARAPLRPGDKQAVFLPTVEHEQELNLALDPRGYLRLCWEDVG